MLPERTVLSLINISNNSLAGGDVTSPAPPAAETGQAAGHVGASEMSSCTTTTSPGTPGLMGSLGLGSSQPYTSVTCTPAAVAH